MKPVERVSIIDNVSAQIKDYVTSGEVKVGDKLLTEKELGERLKVGRSTVREAMRLLEAMGYIEIRAGKGAFVAKTREDDPDVLYRWFASHEPELHEIMEIRMAIEPLAVRLAIERISAQEIRELEMVHEKFARALTDRDVVGLAKSDELYHDLIVRATRNKLLVAINETVARCLLEYRTRSFAVRETAGNALAPHQAILDCIRRKDAARGTQVALEHIEISLRDISSAVAEARQAPQGPAHGLTRAG